MNQLASRMFTFPEDRRSCSAFGVTSKGALEYIDLNVDILCARGTRLKAAERNAERIILRSGASYALEYQNGISVRECCRCQSQSLTRNDLLQTRMPSDQSTWLITVPQDGDSDGLIQELTSKLSQQSKTFSQSSIGQLYIPSFKVPYTRSPFSNCISHGDDRQGRLILSSPSRRSCRNTTPISLLLSPRSSKHSATFSTTIRPNSHSTS
jgi:hypothetical protein